MNIKELIKKYEYLNHNYFRRVDTSEVLKDLRQLDEPQKVTIPQFVADWIETAKKAAYNIRGAIDLAPKGKVKDWLELKNVNTFAKAWVNGYEVEKEKRYFVKLKAVDQYLVSAKDEKFLGFLQSKLRSKFTRKELEDLGFGWVFDCEGIEIEEVEKELNNDQ